jgi:hypothetical protein
MQQLDASRNANPISRRPPIFRFHADVDPAGNA